MAIQSAFAATMVAVSAAAIAGAVGVPKLLQRQHQDEALRELTRLSRSAAIYFVKPRMDLKTQQRAICQFPPGEARTTLALSCCDPKVGDGDGLCDPGKIEWNRTLWSALKWKLKEPHAFVYEYKAAGTLGSARYTVSAYADLDCDGEYSTFRFSGRGGADSKGDDCIISEAPDFESFNAGE